MLGLGLGKVFYHLLPNLGTDCGIGRLELNFVEEAALECAVKITLEVGRGDEDAVKVLHLLQQDVLEGVLHLVHCIFGTTLALADDGIGLVEEQDGRHLAAVHRLTVAFKQRLEVLFAFAHPLALDLRHIDRHNGATRAARQLIDGLGLARAGAAVKQARKALAESLLLHPLVDFAVFLRREERRQFHHLLPDFGGIEHLLGGEVGGIAQIGDSDIAGLEIEFA